jgi:autotransporter-associated beta strand protein
LGTGTSPVTLSGSATLDLGGTTQTVGAVTLSSATSGATIQNGTLAAASLNSQSTGGTNTVNAVLQGSGTLTQSGASTLVLTQSNTYTGLTTVTAGTLMVSGSISGNTNVTGGALVGTGVTGTVNVSAGGTLAPGPVGTIGALLTHDVTFSGGTLAININTSNGTSSQELDSGNLTLGTGAVLTLNELGGNVPLLPGSTTFSILEYSGNWDGGLFQFNGTTIPEAGSFAFGANQYRIDYQAPGDGLSSVTLTVLIPEPGAATSLTAGFFLLAGFGRMRRGKQRHA